MNPFLKTSLIAFAMLGAVVSALAVAGEPSAPKDKGAVAGPGAESSQPNRIVPEAYILYSLALRDAKAAAPGDSTMTVVKQKEKTVYTFKEHVLKECGSHLNGSIEVVDSGKNNLVNANFPVVVNTMGITHFSLQMTEEKANKINAQGSGVVNNQQFAMSDIVTLPGFADAIAKMQ